MFIIPARESGSSLFSNFKIALKMATILALVTSKCCSDLTLLHNDNQYLFLQHHASMFIPASGGKMNQPGHLQPEIYTEAHSNVNLCPGFYLEGYLYLVF